jgi:hypothetical protein
MASTLQLDDGAAITLSAGPQFVDQTQRLLRLECFGRFGKCVTLFLDLNARNWLREKLAEWDRDR